MADAIKLGISIKIMGLCVAFCKKREYECTDKISTFDNKLYVGHNQRLASKIAMLESKVLGNHTTISNLLQLHLREKALLAIKYSKMCNSMILDAKIISQKLVLIGPSTPLSKVQSIQQEYNEIDAILNKVISLQCIEEVGQNENEAILTKLIGSYMKSKSIKDTELIEELNALENPISKQPAEECKS